MADVGDSKQTISVQCNMGRPIGGVLTLLVLVGSAAMADTDDSGFWTETPMDGAVREMKTRCAKHNDQVSCLRFKALTLLDEIFSKDSYQISEAVKLVRNSLESTSVPRSNSDVMDVVEQYVKTHDMVVNLPAASLRISPRNMDQNELSMTLTLPEEQARKSRIKKILVPILAFVLLKAMTLVPLFIGALGLKAWNALQLSFFSFIISVALAVFQLCRKIAEQPPQIVSAHSGGWESARNMQAHDLVYRAHSKTS